MLDTAPIGVQGSVEARPSFFVHRHTAIRLFQVSTREVIWRAIDHRSSDDTLHGESMALHSGRAVSSTSPGPRQARLVGELTNWPLLFDNEPGDLRVAQGETEVKIHLSTGKVPLQVMHHVVVVIVHDGRTRPLDGVDELARRS